MNKPLEAINKIDKTKVFDFIENEIDKIYFKLGYLFDLLDDFIFELTKEESVNFKIAVHSHGREIHLSLEHHEYDHVDLLCYIPSSNIIPEGAKLIGVTQESLREFLEIEDKDNSLFDALYTYYTQKEMYQLVYKNFDNIKKNILEYFSSI